MCEICRSKPNLGSGSPLLTFRNSLSLLVGASVFVLLFKKLVVVFSFKIFFFELVVSKQFPGTDQSPGGHFGPQQILGNGNEYQKETRHEKSLKEFVIGLGERCEFSQQARVVVVVRIGIKKGLVEKLVNLFSQIVGIVVVGSLWWF